MEHLDAAYWQNRYEQQATGWDIGEISRPLKHFIDGLSDRSLSILVPGADMRSLICMRKGMQM
jgi:methyl halide transferase